jgi:hypothetical protein
MARVSVGGVPQGTSNRQLANNKLRTRFSGKRSTEITAAGKDCARSIWSSSSRLTKASDKRGDVRSARSSRDPGAVGDRQRIAQRILPLAPKKYLPTTNESSASLPCGAAPDPETGIRSSHHWLPWRASSSKPADDQTHRGENEP